MPSPPVFHYDVFLSHVSKDKPRVRNLAERLKEAGLRVWLDEWAIKGRDIIASKVDEGLEQSRMLLLCISPSALPSGWVALERRTAIHRDLANSGRRFIPLLLGDCDLPDTLRRHKYVDFREESDAAFAELLATCSSSPVASIEPFVRSPGWLSIPDRVWNCTPAALLCADHAVVPFSRPRTGTGHLERLGA